MGAAVGAAFGGVIGVAVSSGPGFALKSEALGLAVMMELPVVVIDIQRGGPSTGLPTKTEQSDLMLAMYGRNGESPVPIIAAQSPVDCFYAGIEAVRMAIKYMSPVILLSDGYIANGSEPWKVPNPDTIAPIDVKFRTEKPSAEHPYNVYARNATTLAREWVKPGTPGLEHRIGGLEKDALTGAVNYEAPNHQKMIDTRQEKVLRMRNDIPVPMVEGAQEGDLLVVGWGGTYGSLRQTTLRMVDQGKKVGHLHLRWINPLPADLEKIFARFKKVIVCEWNKGQLWRILRAEYLIPALSYTKVAGTPFTTTELEAAFNRALNPEVAQ
jgi:2-oxoglutarate ferredoxin oxidoreductase subunit alpha